METVEPDHYATLGLDRRCTLTQIRAAYRLLAKQHHPDVNPDSAEALKRIRQLNAAHETLSDPALRRAYDREIAADEKPPERTSRIERHISHEVRLRVEEFIRGTKLEVRVDDPANPHGVEIFELEVPPETAPGTRFRLSRAEPFAGGFVQIRVRALPGFRFKVRGSDLKCDLRINARRAAQGGFEMTASAIGAPLRVPIPAGIARGETVRIPNEGLPKPRGGRGDLLVRVTYRPEVRTSRK